MEAGRGLREHPNKQQNFSNAPPPGDTTEHSANPKPISSAAPGITLLQPEPCGEPFCKEHTPVSQLLAI